MASDTPVGAVETMFRVLEVLQDHDTAGVSALAEQVGMPRSTVFNHLKTLEEMGYVVNEGGSYRLGCRFLKLGAKARSFYDVHRVARTEVNRLARTTGEISAVLIEENGLGVFLHRAEGEQAVHIDSYTGQRIYLHGAALGKVILASLPRERVREIIDRHGLPALTDATITTRETLFQELDRIAEDGVAYDDQERLAGLRSVAVPVTDSDGTVLGSISIAGPTSRIQDQQFHDTFPSKLRDAVNVIELDLTYS